MQILDSIEDPYTYPERYTPYFLSLANSLIHQKDVNAAYEIVKIGLHPYNLENEEHNDVYFRSCQLYTSLLIANNQYSEAASFVKGPIKEFILRLKEGNLEPLTPILIELLVLEADSASNAG